jgi:hypothetical protein
LNQCDKASSDFEGLKLQVTEKSATTTLLELEIVGNRSLFIINKKKWAHELVGNSIFAVFRRKKIYPFACWQTIIAMHISSPELELS